MKISSALVLAMAAAAVGVAVNNGGEYRSAVTTEPAANDGLYSPKMMPVIIRKPAGPPMVATGLKDHNGMPAMATCVSCHATRAAEPENSATDDLDEFHQGLTVKHGSLSCVSCHNADDYGTLRLADGKKVEFTDVMTLCAQCHGPQFRDYQHGSHGGMTGYWDLTRGPRQRNNCVDCHDPHAPAYVGVHPAPPPRDRFLTPGHMNNSKHDAKHDAEHAGAEHE